MNATASKPNVLLIVADDMGYGDFGTFNPAVQTPNLNSLITQGTCFRQHYSASPICSPARASLLTGRVPHRTGAITQHELHGLDRIALREVTIADMFQNSGYTTGLVGKWHNGALDARFEPNARGFEEFVGFCGGWSDYYDYTLRVNESYQKSDGSYLTDVFTNEALSFIERHENESFFIQLAYTAPHAPFQAPQEVINKYKAKGYDRITATTYAMIEIMDQGIGRILQHLEDTQLDENTIVLFTSDNGPAFFNPSRQLEPGEKNFNERFNCGMRGSKGWIYEGGIRVPMIVRYPERIAAGQLNNDLVHFTDWLPTLIGLCGIDRLEGPAFDGHDLSPMLLGGSIDLEPRRFWQWNFYVPNIGTNAAMRDGDWKLVRPMISGTRYFSKELYVSEEDELRTKAFSKADSQHKQDPQSISELLPIPRVKLPDPEPPELYNLADDPGEQTDLAQDQPEKTRKMLAELETWFEEVEADRLTIPGALKD
ncbi:sulfatase-like hydrolase/transferase [Opitutia bacterium ISCC 51]|nr:sulfatase-like hydrolase/transferase [Opitutae bacterium ISCC 51]QXD27151.1 sulfatase-like hydrolase/transferase [Opitutae bacterium ISCC 52]